MFLHKIPFVNKKHYSPGGLPVVAAEGAAGAGARLSTREKASISRKRKVQTNPAERKSNVRGSVNPNVSAWDRVNEFKDQCLTTVSGNLRCDACRETLSKKRVLSRNTYHP